MDHKDSLPHWQGLAMVCILSQMNALPSYSIRSILVIFSHLFLPLPSGSIHQVSPTKTLYAFLSYSLSAHSSRDKLRITLKWILCTGVEWIQLVQKGIKWWTFANTRKSLTCLKMAVISDSQALQEQLHTMDLSWSVWYYFWLIRTYISCCIRLCHTSE